MICHRDTNESGRLFVPWPVEGFGTPIVGTATLAERTEPYNLAVELARGKLNDVRNQLADWEQMGLRTTPELDSAAGRGAADVRQGGDRPATTPRPRSPPRRRAWPPTCEGGRPHGRGLHRARSSRTAWPPAPSCRPARLRPRRATPRPRPGPAECRPAFNAAQLRCSWKTIAPTEGQYRWDELDAQLAWCRATAARRPGRPAARLPAGGPARLDLALGRATSTPSSAWSSTIVRQAVTPLPGQGAGLAPGPPPGLRATSSACPRRSRSGSPPGLIQVARQADPTAQLSIGVDRPWAEWMGSSPFQLGPLHLADYLVRADLGLAGHRPGDRPGLLGPREPHPRPLRLLQAARPLRPAEPPPVHLDRPPLRRPGPTRTADPDRPGRAGAMARPARRGDAGRLGREVDRPGGRQAVRPVGHLAPAQRRRRPPLPPRRPLPRRPVPQAASSAWLKSFRNDTLT